MLGAVGPLGRWGIPGLDPGALRWWGQGTALTAPIPMRSRSGNGNGSSAWTCRSGSPSTARAPCPVRAGTPCPWEIIKTAVHVFGPGLGGTEDTRTAAQRRMDGLTAACQAALDSGTAGTWHGAAPHLSVLVDEQTLAAAASSQARETEGAVTWTGASGTVNGRAGSCRSTDGGYSDRRWDRARGQDGASERAGRDRDGRDRDGRDRHGWTCMAGWTAGPRAGPQTAGHPFGWGRPWPGPGSGPP